MPLVFTSPILVSTVENAPPALTPSPLPLPLGERIEVRGLSVSDFSFLKILSSIFILLDTVNSAVSGKCVLISGYLQGRGKESKKNKGFDCFAMAVAFLIHLLKSSVCRELVDAIPSLLSSKTLKYILLSDSLTFWITEELANLATDPWLPAYSASAWPAPFFLASRVRFLSNSIILSLPNILFSTSANVLNVVTLLLRATKGSVAISLHKIRDCFVVPFPAMTPYYLLHLYNYTSIKHVEFHQAAIPASRIQNSL